MPTPTHFPIKQLSLLPSRPLWENCKASIVTLYCFSQGGSDESFAPLRESVCAFRPPFSPSTTLLLKFEMVIFLFSTLILLCLGHIHYDDYVIVSQCQAEANDVKKGRRLCFLFSNTPFVLSCNFDVNISYPPNRICYIIVWVQMLKCIHASKKKTCIIFF